MEGRVHVPESVARMQAKAAQLAEELRVAQTGSHPLTTNSSAAAGCEPALGATWCTSTACTTGSLLQQTGGTPPTPAVFRRLAQANLATVKQPGAAADAQQLTTLQCQKLEAELQLWKCKHADAVKELDRRQDSYMRREEQLKLQLAALAQTQETGDSSGSSSSDGSSSCGQASDPGGTNDASQATAGSSRGQKVQKPLTLQEMQEQVLDGLDDLLQRQKLQMRTEEAQQLRQFRSRLAEIEGQLQACKQAAAAHQGDWMDKTVALREELARTQEIASKLDAMYKLAEEEAAQCRVQFKAQEDDRQHLVRQLIAVKQENSRLRQEQSALQEELDAIIALALEAEAGRPADSQPDNLWGSTALHAAGVRPSTSDSSLAAAINDVVSRRGSSSSVQSAGTSSSAGGRVRPMTAGPGRQRSQAPVQHVRPWSAAAAQQQQGHVRSSTDAREQAAVQAKMERYSHVIQQLKKLLESERGQLRQACSCYTAELSRRTELQGLLLSSIQQAKQQHRAAETAALVQQRQHQQLTQTLPWADERPRSMAASRSRPASCRPKTAGHSGAAAAVGSSQLLSSGRQQSCSRPGSVVQAADGQQSAAFDPAAWEQLLEQLLVRRDVLELLFSRAFPEFMAEASQQQQQQGQPSGGSQGQQGPDAQQLHERWAACQQQQQQCVQKHQQLHQQQEPQVQQYGLGETSPPDMQLRGELLDEGLGCSDSDGDSSGTENDSRAHAAAANAAASTSTASGTGAGDAVDESCGAAVVTWDGQQQQQQQEEEETGTTVGQQPTENTQVTLGGLSAPVMPRFPARQPLHHTIVRRPRSGIVQQQPETICSTRRPASAAAGSQALQMSQGHSPGRPATAACRQAGVLSRHQQQQHRLLGQSAAAGSDAIVGACLRPGSSSSSSSRKGSVTPQGGRPLSAGSKHVWAADASVIASSFLANS